jgi:gamma-glutamyltranspeptidase/glutathione hydrolase
MPSQNIGHSGSIKALSRSILIFIISLLSLPLNGADSPIINYGDRFHPASSTTGMVVSQEKLASKIGAEILAAGGNAIDAAVATGFALAVTFPQAGNIGGGGFMLINLADGNKTVALDYREIAPKAATRDLFLDKDGEVDKNKARFSYLSAGVPGTVAGLVHALENYGTLPLSEVMAPAIALAENGISVSNSQAYSFKRAEQRLARWPASRKYYFNSSGSILDEGNLWRQPDLAAILKAIAARGHDGFYKGLTADLIAEDMKKNNGLITREDLAGYRVVERKPVTGKYRGYDIVTMPPPSSGGVHLIQMLNILEGWDMSALGHNSAAYLHRLIEAMRRAYADRSKYLGDPDYYDVPVQQLVSKAYASRLRENIDLARATPSKLVAPGLELPEESPQTTHFSVWDDQGNVVSNTYTLNFSYGSGIAIKGTGFLINNEMDDFSAKSGIPNAYGLIGGLANAIEPNKRPLSSMTPVIIFKDAQPVLTTGSPGGSTIINTVLQTLLNIIEFDMNIAEAAAASRIHHQWLPDKVYVERGISVDTQQLLTEQGHVIQVSSRAIGRTQTIKSDGQNTYGANDYRWPGGGAIAQPTQLKQ